MGIIPRDALPNLRRYRYGGVDKSLVSRYVLSVYWNNLVKVFPLWIAPNVITLLGLICVLVNVATLFYYSPTLGPCPDWVYTTFGIGLFVYQSLDAIDGKQARRTGMSGPLGELFDHGCDALNTMLGTLTWASSTYLGQSWWTVLSLVASLGNFYLSTWEEYHTGVLYLGYFSGPVEGVLMLVAVHLLSGYYGPAVWTLRVEELSSAIDWSATPVTRIVGALQLNHILIIIGAAVLLLNIVAALINVISVKMKPTELSHPDRSVGKALLGLFPFVYMTTAMLAWLYQWPSLVSDHLALFILFIGLIFGHQVGLMITAHVAKLDFPYFDSATFLTLGSGAVLAYLDKSYDWGLEAFQRPIIAAYVVLAAFQYAVLATSVISEICTYLNIRCLHVKKSN